MKIILTIEIIEKTNIFVFLTVKHWYLTTKFWNWLAKKGIWTHRPDCFLDHSLFHNLCYSTEASLNSSIFLLSKTKNGNIYSPIARIMWLYLVKLKLIPLCYKFPMKKSKFSDWRKMPSRLFFLYGTRIERNCQKYKVSRTQRKANRHNFILMEIYYCGALTHVKYSCWKRTNIF